MTPNAPGAEQELADLRLRLEEAEETLRAIRTGEVDSLLVEGPNGPRVYALEGADSSYRVLVEAMNEGAATLTGGGTILYCNRRFAEMLGLPLEKVIGGAMAAHVAPEQSGTFAELLESGWAVPSKAEVSLRRPDGSLLNVHLSLSALVDVEPVLCVVATDLTEQRRARELRESEGRAVGRAAEFAALLDTVRRAEAELKETDRHKDEFLAVLSHELRNPLAPILNALYILDRAEPGSDRSHHAKQVIARQVDHLSGLVDDLLDITRIAHGKVQLHRGRVELRELVRRAVDDHRAVFAARGIALAFEPDERPHCIDGDAVRLTQVMGNLLQNAAKFTPAHGHVTVTMEQRGSTVAIRVADDGAGMDAATLAHLFEPFRQADHSLHRSLGGLGLGLALVKGLVELHGGRTEARSAGIGRGAELTVWFPLAVGIPLQLEVRRQPARLARRRVLIIEDNLDCAETLKEVLELNGQHVEVAYDGGRDGVAQARAQRPEIVFCDIGLPEIDGYEVARQLRADPQLAQTAPTLIALTGYARPEDRRLAFEAGFDHHLSKPLDLQVLEDLLLRLQAGVRAS